MWYSQKKETSEIIDYSYLDYLFDDHVEANEFLRIFIKELETAKANFQRAIIRKNIKTFRQTYHNVSPHLEILKINHLNLLLQQVKEKLLAKDQPFDDKELFLSTIENAFDAIIKDIHNKLIKVG